MDGIFMSINDQVRFRIIEEFRSGRLNRVEAALKLGVSVRAISRFARKIRKQGIRGTKHGNYGKVPRNRISSEVRDFYVSLYRKKYAKFNFSHALEKILELESPSQRVSYDVFRRWCRKEGLGKVKKRRCSKAHFRRERSANEGFMLQMDGSPHKWNGKDEWTMIATIDDATSDVGPCEFFESETTWGCMTVMQRVIERKGIPEFILTDCAGWSTGGAKRQGFSQFVRACDELGIKVIGTPSAESKGRVERLNRTMQDRLVPELDLLGIKLMKDANRYLEQVFLPDLRKRIGIEAKSSETRYRSIPEGVDVRKVFCLKYHRQVNRDHTVQFEAQQYDLKFDGVGSLWKKEVRIHKYKDGEIEIYHGHRSLRFALVRPKRRYAWGNK